MASQEEPGVATTKDNDKLIQSLTVRVAELEEQLNRRVSKRKHAEKFSGDAKEVVTQLEDEIFIKSEELVKQAEKSLQTGRQLQTAKESLTSLQTSVSNARNLLFTAIAGKDVDTDSYSHVAIDELVRIHLRALSEISIAKAENLQLSLPEGEESSSPKHAGDATDYHSDFDEGSPAKPSPPTSSKPVVGTEYISGFEKERQKLIARNRTLAKRIEVLETELQDALTAKQLVDDLRGKTMELADRTRSEKELRQQQQQANQEAQDKIAKLSQHIEKLMVHLKHEAAAKAKATESQRRTEQELEMMRQRNATLAKKNQEREQLIAELKEGSKILEDQLRLMDEKYIELRNKLDHTRAQSQKEIKRLEEDASELRMQLELVQATGSRQSSDPLRGKKKSGNLKVSETQALSTSSFNDQINVSPGRRGMEKTEASSNQARPPITVTLPTLHCSSPTVDESLPWSDAKANGLAQQLGRKR